MTTVTHIPTVSNGCLLDVDLHLPDDGGAGAPYPVIIPCSGYQGMKVIHPERFARALTPLGYAVAAFDYRGQGDSEGERGRVVPQEEAEDVRAVAGRLQGIPDADAGRLGLIGWGMGGGVVVAAAADDPTVRGVAVVNGIGDGYRSTQAMHDQASWDSLLERVAADRARRAERGRSDLTSPWDIVRLDLDTATDSYVGDELYKAPGFGWPVTLESADYLLRFRPEDVVARISPRPLLIVHGERNELYKLQEARELYRRAAEPKRLEVLEGFGHTEWMFDEHPTFRRLVEMLNGFFSECLQPR